MACWVPGSIFQIASMAADRTAGSRSLSNAIIAGMAGFASEPNCPRILNGALASPYPRRGAVQ